MRYRASLLILAAATATSAAAQNAPAPAAWSRNAGIYEINVRQYTPEGTFAALDRHLPRLESLDVDILWIMPVQPIGKKNRKGPLGSYYSISELHGGQPGVRHRGRLQDVRRRRASARE